VSIDIHKLVRDHRISVADLNDKHHRENWVNLPCPFCEGGGGFHLGYNILRGYWNCYRCGWHNETEVIKETLKISWSEAQRIRDECGGRPILRTAQERQERPSALALPPSIGELAKSHRRYLRERGYRPRILAEEWGLMGTGPIGGYKFRIIAPIFHQGRMVSYLGRDITNKSTLKYKACPGEDEIINHKNILYGLDSVRGHSVIIVEGVTDVWRLGPGAVATFGQEWSMPQVRLLKEFPRRFILFDSEKQAQKEARKLAGALAGFSGSTEIITLTEASDPGELSEDAARKLMRELLGAV